MVGGNIIHFHVDEFLHHIFFIHRPHIDYHYNVILNKHPEWVKEAHQQGMKVNVWTVNKEDMMKKLIDMKVDYITTDQPLEAKKLTE